MSFPGWILRAVVDNELVIVDGGIARYTMRDRRTAWIHDLLVPPETVLGKPKAGTVELRIFTVLAAKARVRCIEIHLPATQQDGAVPVLLRNGGTIINTETTHKGMKQWWLLDITKGLR